MADEEQTAASAGRIGASKLMSAEEAVSRFVRDGDTLFLGYSSWAFGLEREIARQRKRRLRQDRRG